MMMFLTWIGNLLAGPLISNALAAYKAKLAADTSTESLRSQLAAAELITEQKEMELQTQYRIAEIGHWYEPDKIMGYTCAALLAKLVIWDTILQYGTTDLHNGWMTTTLNLIVAFYFGKRGFENVAKIIARK